MKRRICCSKDATKYSEFLYIVIMYGFASDDKIDFIKELPNDYISMIYNDDDNSISVSTKSTDAKIYELNDLVKYLDTLMNLYEIEIFSCTVICNPSEVQTVVQAAISTRDLSKNMVRVKSSNVWSYSINIRDRKSGVGDVIAQFKNNQGGPGDVYLYYDVPVKVYRQWIAASSKGSFFWRFIRNKYMYKKLTGDKRGKLRNAVN